LFHKRAARFKFFALLAGLLLVLEHHHRGVLGEIDATLVALHAMVLNVPAGGTDETDGTMTAKAELRGFRIFGLAFGTAHNPLKTSLAPLIYTKAGPCLAILKTIHTQGLVDAKGFEPSTSALRTPRSPN
jgi:hypothetical protein